MSWEDLEMIEEAWEGVLGRVGHRLAWVHRNHWLLHAVVVVEVVHEREVLGEACAPEAAMEDGPRIAVAVVRKDEEQDDDVASHAEAYCGAEDILCGEGDAVVVVVVHQDKHVPVASCKDDDSPEAGVLAGSDDLGEDDGGGEAYPVYHRVHAVP